ncbi:hypothetical protein TGFOU_320105 [Toxoplasma gondii FOU]|uniref:Uncharacterized protein n=1 Tax=Toxoplasma gondii FOU TaxID=943167 RepID=A0A086KGH9_TOXGO|nr:hypothetical protein TGFOU_320105 [Toxoplasma gondii FOU]
MFLCLKTSPCPSNYCCKVVERHQYRSHSPAFLHRELGFRSMSRWIVRPRIFFASHTCAPFWIFRSRSQYTCTGHLGPIRGVFCLGSLKLPPERVPPIHQTTNCYSALFTGSGRRFVSPCCVECYHVMVLKCETSPEAEFLSNRN